MSFEPSFSAESMFLTARSIFPLDEQLSADLISDSALRNSSSLALNNLEIAEWATNSFRSSVAVFEDYSAQEETVYSATGEALDPVTGLFKSEALASIQSRADGSRSAARDIGVLKGSRTFRDSVDRGDRKDYYKFTLTRRKEFSLLLTNLSANANVQLLDADGRMIKSSTKRGADSESIAKVLNAGDYFVQVYSAGKNVDTDYRLTLSANAVGFSKPDRVGNGRDTARNLGTLRRSKRAKDFVGSNDKNDFYRFNLSEESEFNLLLTGLEANANVRLMNSRGRVIQTSANRGEADERIERTLGAGDYFIHVLPYKRSDTAYKLRLFATETNNDNPDTGEPGNSRGNARNVGTLRGDRTFQDFIGSGDTNDYYRFDLERKSDFGLALTGLSADAEVQLLNGSGQVIESSTGPGSSTETITRSLNAGSYYVRVYPYSGSTNYTLNLSATEARPDLAGNSLATALNIGKLDASRTFQDFIGLDDTNDYYRFTLDNASDFELALSDLSADAEVQLLNNSGQVIESSTRSGSNTETITRSLTAGRYYVRVYPYSGSTDYTLNLSATEIQADLAGNNFASARDIGSLGSARSFRDLVGTTDTNDYYRFTLNRSSNFRLTLNGLSADADVELLRSDGSLLQSSLNARTNSEQIAQVISAGTYYVRVYPFSGTTNYNLTLSATAISNQDGVGDTLGSARNIGTLRGTQTFREAVGAGVDANDYYRFSIDRESGFELSLTGLSADVDVEVLDANGQSLASSTGPDTSDEGIGGTISPGTYYVRVYPDNVYQFSNYQLTLSATELSADFDTTYGYGLVDAAAGVAAAIGRTSPFPEREELGGINWGLDLVNAPEAWNQGYSGEGVVIAVVDTGVDYLHNDLADNTWRNTDEIAGNGIDDDGNGYIDDTIGWDFIGRDADPYDEHGHGTHVAGTAAAVGFNGGVTGVAYESEIMAIRVLGANGSSVGTSTADGIRYAADNGADVINLSLGSESLNSAVQDAVQYATRQGAFVVMASGNDGASRPGYPASFATDYGVAVGAVDRYKTAADFSNDAGTNSDMRYVVAPGVSIYSTTPGNSYGYKNGTSMATPHVAGVVALMLEANPNLTHAQIRQILIDSSARLS